jgi:hypothetical protein
MDGRQMAKINELKARIAAETKANGFALVKKDPQVNKLASEGHIEFHPTAGANAAGEYQARATDKLHAELAATAAPAAEKPKFEILTGVPVINGVRGGVREEVYPFSQLEIGQSFLVPCDTDKPTPKDVVEKFSSTVSSATRRYAEPSATETRTNKAGETVPVLVATRKFTLRPVTKGQTYPGSSFVEPQDGARVYRTA